MLNVLKLKSMNIEEKKLEQVQKKIKAIFDEEYKKDADKVYWYLVAIHIMKSDVDVKYCVGAHSVRISDFHLDDDISGDYERECDIVKNVDVTLIYRIMLYDKDFWNSHYADIVNFIIDYYFSIDKIGADYTTPSGVSSLMAYFVQKFGSKDVFDPCAGLCGIAFQPEMKDVNFQGIEIKNRIKVLADIKLSTLPGYKRCDPGTSLDDDFYDDYYDFETMVSDLPFGVKIDDKGLTMEDFFVSKFIEEDEFRNAVLVVSPSFVDNSISLHHKDLIENGYVEMVITLPSCTYDRTSVSPVMLVLNKDRRVISTTFIDARDCAVKIDRKYCLDSDKVKQRIEENDSIFAAYVECNDIISHGYSLNQRNYLKVIYDINPDEKLYKIDDVAKIITGETKRNVINGKYLLKENFSTSLFDTTDAEKEHGISEKPYDFRRVVNEPCVVTNNSFSKYYIKTDNEPVNVAFPWRVYKINEQLCLSEYFVYKMREIYNNSLKGSGMLFASDIDYIPLYPLESQKHILERARRKEQNVLLEKLRRLHYLGDMSSDLLHNLGVIFSRIGCSAASLGNVKDNIELKTIDSNVKFAIRQINMTGADYSSVTPIFKKVNLSELIDEYLDEWQLAGFKTFRTREATLLPEDTKVKVDIDMFKSMMDCILINAHQHGFSRHYSVDNTVLVNSTGVFIDGKQYVQIEISNNGNPFPDGMTLNDYASRGIVGINSHQDGIGGDHIIKILHHFGGKLAIEQTSKWFSVLLFIPVYLTSDISNFNECEYECI